MKRILIIAVAAVLLGWGVYTGGSKAAEGVPFQTYEYATIRWSGKEHTHLIRPNGKVEFLGPILTKISRPDRVDERTYYMNVAMNAVAKEGFEVVAITNDEVLMKRPVSR